MLRNDAGAIIVELEHSYEVAIFAEGAQPEHMFWIVDGWPEPGQHNVLFTSNSDVEVHAEMRKKYMVDFKTSRYRFYAAN